MAINHQESATEMSTAATTSPLLDTLTIRRDILGKLSIRDRLYVEADAKYLEASQSLSQALKDLEILDESEAKQSRQAKKGGRMVATSAPKMLTAPRAPRTRNKKSPSKNPSKSPSKAAPGKKSLAKKARPKSAEVVYQEKAEKALVRAHELLADGAMSTGQLARELGCRASWLRVVLNDKARRAKIKPLGTYLWAHFGVEPPEAYRHDHKTGRAWYLETADMRKGKLGRPGINKAAVAQQVQHVLQDGHGRGMLVDALSQAVRVPPNAINQCAAQLAQLGVQRVGSAANTHWQLTAKA